MVQRPPPNGYTSPRFPSLNWELTDPTERKERSLFYIRDIWSFTVLWTLIIYAVFHLGAAAIAVVMHGHRRSGWKFLWAVPVVYLLVAAAQALLSGSVVGLMLGAIYNAGYFSMSPWIPLAWGIINVLVLVISSFSIQGGL
ncbi:related to integral membrane protein [Cephalotrichum gorgonifer]|uniref:Related to integral membrane protein n=1 Tax=Cephalotrichum gorgonifer TaxID=2041049 RepID=A0AAE8MXR1_9PEZI|nr:related to integral membrane protein [Cephalotrichum gorgonifer]